MTIVEHVLGPEHPETAILLDSLAYFSRFQGKYEQAQALHQQALRIKEQTFGPEHPETAFGLDSLRRCTNSRANMSKPNRSTSMP